MSISILLRVTAERDGRWRILVGSLKGRLVEAEVDRERVDQVRAAVEAWQAVEQRRVPIRGQDTRWRRAEEDLGRALVRCLGATQDLTQGFATHLGAAQGQQVPLVVIVDVEDPVLRRVPWELLATDATGLPLETAGAGVVTRLVGRGQRPRPLSDPVGMDVAVWCPTPEDPACADVLAGLDATLHRADAGPARRLYPGHGGPPGDDGRPIVVHVVCHGRRDADEVHLLLSDGAAGPDSAVAAVGRWIGAAEVVILDVCQAGAHTAEALDALPARFLACGARAVIAPTRHSGTEASRSFIRGFYAAWAQGGTLAQATASGRTEVRAMGLGLLDSRWYNHVLYVGDTEAVDRPGPLPTVWRPTGWPRPSRAAEEYLQVVKQAADDDGLGFVGVEHLAMALLSGASPGALSAKVRLALTARAHKLPRMKVGLDRIPGRAADPGGTPRLRAWAARLDARGGYSCDDIWRLVCADPCSPLHEIARPYLVNLVSPARPLPVGTADPGTLSETVFPGPREDSDGSVTPDPSPSQEPFPDVLAAGLQIVSGPEDGRTMYPAPGEWIGRWAGLADVAHALYETTLAADRTLHRYAAQWVGRGRLDVRWPSRVFRRGVATDLEPGIVVLAAGDLLELAKATRVRGIPPGRDG